LKRAVGIDPAARFISHAQKCQHFPRFARAALPQIIEKWRVTAKLTDFRGFSVSRRFIFTFVKKAA
jgi:hypothetical protein